MLRFEPHRNAFVGKCGACPFDIFSGLFAPHAREQTLFNLAQAVCFACADASFFLLQFNVVWTTTSHKESKLRPIRPSGPPKLTRPRAEILFPVQESQLLLGQLGEQVHAHARGDDCLDVVAQVVPAHVRVLCAQDLLSYVEAWGVQALACATPDTVNINSGRDTRRTRCTAPTVS
jgi:hypothetical protein